jgi:hypothetical protein
MNQISLLDVSQELNAAPREGSQEVKDGYFFFKEWRPTPVFETFWRFATERQAIFYRRLTAGAGPYTNDQTLATYKFTNVYRATDRVSQFLIRNVIYAGDQSPRELFFRTVLFKLFNKIGTWKLFCNQFGEITSRIAIRHIDLVLTRAMESGQKIYSGAYIMPSGTKEFREARKHRAHLRLLEQMMKDDVSQRLVDSKSMADAFSTLRSYPMVGDFLAYQYLIDLNYSNMLRFSESDFVVPGPGAKSGLRKCFSAMGQTAESDIIHAVAENQESEFALRGLNFRFLAGRRLQLIDCQNLFCEIDKYARATHPEISGQSNRTRIKQKFSPHNDPIDYWFPPKWGINQAFHSSALARGASA